VELVLEREKESSSIFFVSIRCIPRDRRETSTSTTSLFNFEECDGRALIISPTMKIIVHPAMITTSIKKHSFYLRNARLDLE
jgi:hypothetical protein